MKIIVNGNIIDTENIYMIHKIIQFDVSDDYMTYIDDNNDSKFFDVITHTKDASFIIESFNDKEICIELKYDFTGIVTKSAYKKMINDTNDKVSKFREQITSVWLEKQTDIPQYNLK